MIRQPKWRSLLIMLEIGTQIRLMAAVFGLSLDILQNIGFDTCRQPFRIFPLPETTEMISVTNTPNPTLQG